MEWMIALIFFAGVCGFCVGIQFARISDGKRTQGTGRPYIGDRAVAASPQVASTGYRSSGMFYPDQGTQGRQDSNIDPSPGLITGIAIGTMMTDTASCDTSSDSGSSDGGSCGGD